MRFVTFQTDRADANPRPGLLLPGRIVDLELAFRGAVGSRLLRPGLFGPDQDIPGDLIGFIALGERFLELSLIHI